MILIYEIEQTYDDEWNNRIGLIAFKLLLFQRVNDAQFGFMYSLDFRHYW